MQQDDLGRSMTKQTQYPQRAQPFAANAAICREQAPSSSALHPLAWAILLAFAGSALALPSDPLLVATYQALKRLDWLGTAYQGGLRESADVMVDFYDEQGVLVRSSRHPARKTATGDDVMNPGEVGTLRIAKPQNAKSYRVWVVK